MLLTKQEEFGTLLFVIIAYPLIASILLRLPTRLKWISLAALNIVSILIVTILSFLPIWIPYATADIPKFFRLGPIILSGYVVAVLLNYGALQLSKSGTKYADLLAYLTPIVMLFAVRLGTLSPHLPGRGVIIAVFLGISYVSFRLCHLVAEVKNGAVEMPDVWQYLAFAFYIPLLFVGPISPYSMFKASIDKGPAPTAPWMRILTRILVGVAKFIFVSAVLSEVTYGNAFLSDEHPHHLIDLVVSVLVYPIYLYMNFSGMCDIAIGVSAALGIEVVENFDRPFAARNFQEFWSRWHMSLSFWARDMVFTPFVKSVGRKIPREQLVHANAVGIMLVFLVIGLWHGFTANFVLFGISQGIGVVVVHYSKQRWRRKLGKEGFERYQSSKFYYVLAVTGTYLYFSLTLILFANSLHDIHDILKTLVL